MSMSNKRQGQDGGRNTCAAAPGGDKRPRRQKHLYLVLDDWDKGYNIYKMDADSFDDDQAARHLPEPPALRIESPAGPACMRHNAVSFSALGTKIFALMNQRCGLVYDTETGVLGVGAHAPLHMECGSGISVAVGSVLYALTYRPLADQRPIDLEAMSWAPTGVDRMQQPTEGWSWKALPPPPPTFRGCIQSYVLHPDGCTIFMTTTLTDSPGTYSFNTKESTWRWHGQWALPFLGRAHFDSELDAWVGLGHDGHICCCQVVSPNYYNNRIVPSMYLDCKATEEKLFRKDRERHMSASLTYMGTSKFCLVECVSSRKLHDERPAWGDHDYVLSVTMFGLKYNHKGELRTTHHRSTRSFLVSRHRYYFDPFAFWM